MINIIAEIILNRIKRKKVPYCLKKNQIEIDSSQLKKIEISIKENYHQGWRSENNYTSEAYAADLRAHLIDRLEMDRIKYIPWFNKAVPLNGCNILEIGCGTGSSTIALAEQGAKVTGIDIDEDVLKVARDRCDAYNVSATFICGNASEVYNRISNQRFDLIIFFACMEHMTYAERIDCLRKYNSLLADNGYLSIVETPNRLWYFDSHTSLLPFFHWLPDKVAFDYTKFSNRENFKELYPEYSEERFMHFLRRGRGFSFHELEIAFNTPAERLGVVDYLRKYFLINSLGSKFHKLLLQINPKISKGFFYPYIDIILRKQQIS